MCFFLKIFYCLEDEQNTPTPVSTPLESAGSSIKVTLKKKRTSRSSSSSRESTQSFEVRNYYI